MASSAPSTRSDATRNRRRILDAARDAFDRADSDASMAEIARRSGVGSATLYRNFGSRRELLEALLVDEVNSVCDAAATVDGESSSQRLLSWLRRVYDYVDRKRPVVIELVAHTDVTNPVFDTRARILHAGEPLFAAARLAGEITDRLELSQMLDLVMMTAKVPGPPEYRQPMLDVVLSSFAALAGDPADASPENR